MIEDKIEMIKIVPRYVPVIEKIEIQGDCACDVAKISHGK